MNNNTLTLTTNGQQRSVEDTIKALWNSKGSNFSKITGVLAIGGIGYGLYCALPFLIAMTTNLITLAIECVVLAILLYVFTSKSFWHGLQLFWLQITRKIYGIFVKMNPIAILEQGIENLHKQYDVVVENITNLQGTLEGMKKKLNTYKDEFIRNKAKLEESKKRIADPQTPADARDRLKANMIVLNNEVMRNSDQIQKQTQRIATSEKYLSVMKKLEIAANAKIKDMESELSYRKDEYENAKSQESAIKAIGSIFSGGFSRSLEEELAIDEINNTINHSLAEMSRLLDGSNNILTDFELESSVNASKVDEILKMFDEGGFEMLDGTANVSALPQPASTPYLEAEYASGINENGEKVLVPVKSKYF